MPKVRFDRKTRQPTFIREWRKFRGFTLREVAERLDVTVGSLSQLERGEIAYTQAMLERLAEILNCAPVDLLIRDPRDPEGIWTVWDDADLGTRRQIVELAKTLVRTAAK